ACGLKHGNLDLTAAQQHLHCVNDANTADEEGQQTDDAQEQFNLVNLALTALEQVLGSSDAHGGKCLAKLGLDGVNVGACCRGIDGIVLGRQARTVRSRSGCQGRL